MADVPVEYKCLIELEPVEEKTAGGIYIPEERLERDQLAASYATLLRVGGNAFEDWEPPRPEAGDRILVSRYAGQPLKSAEANMKDLYRMVQDKEIIGIAGLSDEALAERMERQPPREKRKA